MNRGYLVFICLGLLCIFYSQGEAISPPPLSWSTTIGGSGSDDSLSIKQTPDGGYIFIGSTDSFGAGPEFMREFKEIATSKQFRTKIYHGWKQKGMIFGIHRDKIVHLLDDFLI